MRHRRLWLILAAVAVLSAATLACETVAVRRAQRARAPLGDRLYVEAIGEGPRTVVFLPGLLGSTRYWRAAGLAPVGGVSRFLYVDLLGFGRSPWPDSGYTLDDHVMALRRTLVHEGATRHVTLVAHSFGALVAAEYAARFPDEIDRLVLFGAPVYRSADEARREAGRISWLAGLAVGARPAARIVCVFHNAMGPCAAFMAARLRPDLPPNVARDGALHFWPSFDGTIQNAILCHPMTESLRGSGLDITFVHGARDRVAPLDRVRAIAVGHGARFMQTADDHGSYWRSAGAVLVGVGVPLDHRALRAARVTENGACRHGGCLSRERS